MLSVRANAHLCRFGFVSSRPVRANIKTQCGVNTNSKYGCAHGSGPIEVDSNQFSHKGLQDSINVACVRIYTSLRHPTV